MRKIIITAKIAMKNRRKSLQLQNHHHNQKKIFIIKKGF